MNIMNLTKFFNAIPPGVIKDNAPFVSNVIDRQADVPTDAKGVLFVVQLGATDVAASVLRVQQSDTKTDATTLGGSPTTVHDFATKPGANDDNALFGVYVPTSKWTERYLQLQATAGDGTTGTYLSALAVFDQPGTTGTTAADLGLTVVEVA